eukprot:3941834-Rhodomonas_salina.2
MRGERKRGVCVCGGGGGQEEGRRRAGGERGEVRWKREAKVTQKIFSSPPKYLAFCSETGR